ncbi:MAG: maltose alpha-D-glucosyltransferase [Myxococcales bacterium]|nr:maltose alpha-D-glucosyltransferase [Myxococcales bacterium]
MATKTVGNRESDPSWYKDAVFYELRIRTFFDSNGDGVGDIRGLIQKLDYLVDLGVTTLWLLPFYPSPLRDDGYDIADYRDVHPAVGNLGDFRALIRAAHERGLRIVTELVLNHTSDQHAWFQRARRAPPGSKERDYYVWSDTPERYADARIIFTDYEASNWTWDPVAKAYYWHRFFFHQPDLNFENPEVRQAMFDNVDFWLELGVDGLRLDAVPYLFEREGSSCENLPETHAYLRELRRHVDRQYPGRMLLAEANQWPEDAVAYFGDDDECHMAFHFPIMPRLFLALRTEEAFPIIDTLAQTPPIPEAAQWAIFLRNHDELTLEMVTDDERDLMLRAYAEEPEMRVNVGIRRRLAPLLGNNRRRIELLNALLFSLPGTPVLYYGDEIGMGDNIYLGDRNGVRTPMQWSPDRNAGFSRANPQRLFLPPIIDPENHYESVNVENQQRNPSSLLWWTKRLIALRKQHAAFGRGTFRVVASGNRSVLAFTRQFGDETILVVANMSRFAQYAELDMPDLAGLEPVELFGRNRFPALRSTPYPMSIGPHEFFWFALENRLESAKLQSEDIAPDLRVWSSWTEILDAKRLTPPLERSLRRFLARQRWFRSKSRELDKLRIAHSFELPNGSDTRLTFVEVGFSSGEPETYVTALGLRPEGHPDPIARVRRQSRQRAQVVVDVSGESLVPSWLFEVCSTKKRVKSPWGTLVGTRAPALGRKLPAELAVRPLALDQTNTTFVLGDSVTCKVSRRVEEAPSVEVELLAALAPRAAGLGIPELLGTVDLLRDGGLASTLATFTTFIPNHGTAWQLSVDEVHRYFDRVLSQKGTEPPASRPGRRGRRGERSATDPQADVVGGYVEVARRLGQRVAALHVALAEAPGAELGVAPFTGLARRSAYQALRTLGAGCLESLKKKQPDLPDSARELAQAVLGRRRAIEELSRSLTETNFGGRLIRVHGDLHLGQILHTGNDFAIIDFEGEPGRSPADRRRRRSPLVDVAGMLRSLSYAVYGVLRGEVPLSGPRHEDTLRLEPWARLWVNTASHALLEAYAEGVAAARIVPEDEGERLALLRVFVLEKALYEVSYELDNRPGWVAVPLQGVLDVLE